LIWLLDQQFYEGKPATNQIEFLILKRPVLSILSLRGHVLSSFAGRARLSFPFTQQWQNASQRTQTLFPGLQAAALS